VSDLPLKALTLGASICGSDLKWHYKSTVGCINVTTT